MHPSLSHPNGRRLPRMGCVALAALLASTIAATPQGGTPATVRPPPGMRGAARKFDSVTKMIPRPPAGDDVFIGPAGQQRSMPSLVGLDTMAAIDSVVRKKLGRYRVIAPKGLVPLNRVASQRPAAGTPLSGGVMVMLILDGRSGYTPPIPARDTTSRKPRRVPDVVGRTEAEALALLAKGSFGAEARRENATNTQSIGRVVRQSPLGGTTAVAGSRVSIAVGRDARVRMPRVTSRSVATAKAAIAQAGIVAPFARVPDVVGLDSMTAIARMAEAGLSTLRIQLPRAVGSNYVVGTQSPGAGQQVPRTTSVVLSMRGPALEEAIVPSVLELTVDSATRLLAGQQFGVRIDEWRWTSRLRGIVRRQVPDSGTRVLRGATVTIVPDRSIAVIALVVVLLGGGAAAAVAARAVWPAPIITPRIAVQPGPARLARDDGPLVADAIGIRSHVEHLPATFHPAGAP